MTHDTPKKALLPIDAHLLDPDLAVWRHHGTSGQLAISFTGIGASMSPVPPFEFAKIATEGGKHDALFISGPNRSWLNGTGVLARIAGMIVHKCGHQLPRQLRKRPVLEKVARMALNNRTRQVRLTLEKLGGHRRTYKNYPALAPSCEVLK